MDLILWQLAESGDTGAISRFEMTHPALKGELASRVSALEGLRGFKPLPGEAMIPPFKPVALAPLIPAAWIATTVVGALVIGTASFFVTRDMVLKQPDSMVTNHQSVQAPISVPEVKTDPVEIPDEPVIDDSDAPSMSDLPRVIEGQEEDGSDIGLPRDQDMEDEALVLPKHTFTMNEVMLTTVIKAICKDANLAPTFAPGFTDKKVTVKLEGQTRVGLLKSLADKYGFSAVETGKNEVLIIPAPDEGPINPNEPIAR